MSLRKAAEAVVATTMTHSYVNWLLVERKAVDDLRSAIAAPDELAEARQIMFELLRYADDEGISNSRWLRGTLQSAREFLKRTER